MQHRSDVIRSIETRMDTPESALAIALADLNILAKGRGTCLLLETEVQGEMLIADANWPLGMGETRSLRDTLALVDLRDDGELRRVAILAAPQETPPSLRRDGCDLIVAALNAIEEIAVIAAQFAKDVLPSGVVAGRSLAPMSIPAE